MNFVCFLRSLLVAGCLAGAVLSQDLSDDSFALYLLPANVTTKDLTALDLRTIKLRGQPIVHQNSIFSYNKDSHRFEIFDYELRNL